MQRMFQGILIVLVTAGWIAASYAQDGISAAAQAAAAAKQGWPAEVRRAFGFEDVSLWDGEVQLVTEPVKDGEHAIQWSQHAENTSLSCLASPTDLSAFNVMSFWLHSSHANGETFMIIVESRREEDAFSYYSKKVTVDWTGWKQVTFHYRSFGKARRPAGWNQVDRIRFTSSGWNQRPQNEATWVFDGLDFSYTDEPYRPVIKVATYVEAPEPTAFLENLRMAHPRLILLDSDLDRIRRLMETDPEVKEWYDRARERADWLAQRPVRERVLPDGRRLLSVSRDVVNRLYHWGFFYRMDGDRKWLDRAWREMEAVVNFTDWNPWHYLDTAEMMHAVAIGYDWCYNGLSDEQRKIIREGLWQHGLRLSYAAYMGLDAEGHQGWRRVTNNWNFVCNGGTAIAAMALLDEMPEECTELLHQSFQYIQIPIHHFEPDGAWWEGVGYWGYSIRYFVPYLRGLETAFGTDFGFIDGLRGTGFSMAGDFPVYLVSPLGGVYNFADSGSGGGSYQHHGLFYLAEAFDNPLYLHFQKQRTRGGLFDLIYYKPFESDMDIGEVPRDKQFRKTEVATLRSSWTDRNALFAGIKCGRNGIAHAHQDLGSFVFYGLGEKWFVDLGSERQTYLRHQHHLPKKHFYRIREEGHNTLVFDADEEYCQDYKGEANIVRFETSSKDAFAIADLTHAYREYATSVRRGYRLFDERRAFLVQDEIESGTARDLWWFAHSAPRTEFAIEDGGRRARLQRRGKTCHAYLLSPAAARFTVMDAQPLPSSPDPDIQNENRGVRKLAIHLPQAKTVTIAALFVPVYDMEPVPDVSPAVEPLASWSLAATERPLLRDIQVDGASLEDFSPTVYAYTVGLPDDTETLPALTAMAAEPTAKLVIDAPDVFPGTARITVTAADGDHASVYRVRFLPKARPGSSDKAQMKSKTVTVDGITVSASHDDGNVPQNVLDDSLETRWSANGPEEWIAFEFSKPRMLADVGIAWYNGNLRQTKFTISVSGDGKNWDKVFEGWSTGKSKDLERYSLDIETPVKHVRITGYGNSLNLWNSITEVDF